jgi:KDO2-lipid IV(A) lauroyltransferase
MYWLYLPVMTFLSLLARLPFFVLYRLSDLLFVLTAYVIRYRRRVIVDNLRHAFPEAPDSRIYELTREFYRNFCDVIVETIKLPRITAEEMQRRVVVINGELVRQYLSEGQTVLGAGAHQCNWEWVPAATLVNGIPVDSVYKPLHNASSERFMQQIRSTFGAYLVPMNRLPREMVTRRHLPRIIALVADQMPNIPEAAYWTNFFHRDTPFFPGTERLARSQQLPVFYLDLSRNRRGYYTATFSLLAAPPYTDLPYGEILERYRDRLTETIHKQPANWLWSHKRWKHQREKYAKINTKLE